MDRFIVMDDVSGVADNCKKFAEFLTVCRKDKYHWKKHKFGKNKKFVIFSLQAYLTILYQKYYTVTVNKHKKIYIPACYMWLHRVFTDLANTNKRHCLTIDCSGVNKNGPGRYRTQADNPDKQVCYFNKTRDDEFYNVFKTERINSGSFDKGIYFQITRVRDNNETFDAEKTLEQDGATDDRLSKTEFDTEPELLGRALRKRGAKELSKSDESRITHSRKSARPRFLSRL